MARLKVKKPQKPAYLPNWKKWRPAVDKKKVENSTPCATMNQVSADPSPRVRDRDPTIPAAL